MNSGTRRANNGIDGAPTRPARDSLFLRLALLLLVGAVWAPMAEDETADNNAEPTDAVQTSDNAAPADEDSADTAENQEATDDQTQTPSAEPADAGDSGEISDTGQIFERQQAIELIDELRGWPTPIKREVEERTGIDIDELSSLEDEEISYARLRQVYRTWQTAAELASASLRSSTRDDSSEFSSNCPLNRFCQPRLDCIAEGLDPKICRALKRKRVRGAVRDSSKTTVVSISRNTRPNTERFLGDRSLQWRTSEEDFVYRTQDSEVVDELIRRREASRREIVQLTGYVDDVSIDPERMSIELDYLHRIEDFWKTIAELEDAVVELRVHKPEQLLNLSQAEQFGTMADVSWLVGTELSKALRTHTDLGRDQVRVRVVTQQAPEAADDDSFDDEDAVDDDATDDDAADIDGVQLSSDIINAIRVRVEVLFFHSRLKPEFEAEEESTDEEDEGEAEPEPSTRADALQHHRVAVCHIEQLCLIRRKVGDDTKVQLRNVVPDLPADQYRNPRSAWVEAVRQLWLRYQDRPGARLRLLGHSDSEELPAAVAGDYPSARAYTQFQAQVVAGVLLQRLGLRASDVHVAGYGNERLLANNNTALNRATNRRIEVELWYDSVDDEVSLPDEPQVCPSRSEEERISLSVDMRRYGIDDIVLPVVNGQVQISDEAVDSMRLLLRENSDKDNLRLYFIGHTDKKTLLRRVAKVYGDHFGLSRARALSALREVAERLRVNPNTMVYQGLGYLEPLVELADEGPRRATGSGGVSPFDLIVEDAETGPVSETQVNDRVEVKVIYDQIARIQREYGLRADQIDIERIQRPSKPVPAFLTNVMRVTEDGIPISDRRIHLADIQRCTDVALADAGIRFRYDASKNRKRLSVSAHPLGADYLDDPGTDVVENRIEFQMHTNYSHWIKRAEVRLFYADETVESRPLAVVELNRDGYGVFDANIYMARDATATELQYVLRVYHQDDIFDETHSARLRLHHNRASKLWIDRYGRPPAHYNRDYGRAVPGAPLPGEKESAIEDRDEPVEPSIFEVVGALSAEDLSLDDAAAQSTSAPESDAGLDEGSDDDSAATDESDLPQEIDSELNTEADNDAEELTSDESITDELDEADLAESGEGSAEITVEEAAAEAVDGERAEDDPGADVPPSDVVVDGVDKPDGQLDEDGDSADSASAEAAETSDESDDSPPAQLSGVDVADLLSEENIYDESKPLALPTLSQAPERKPVGELSLRLLSSYGENTLAKDNIEVYGGSITIEGSGIPSNHRVWTLSKQIPVNKEGQFVSEEIVPYGVHTAEIAVVDDKGQGSLYLRNLEINKNKWFYTGLFDLTLGSDVTRGPANVITQDTVHYNNSFFIDGQIGFYARGNLGNGGIFRFSVDTGEAPIRDIFRNVVNKDPQLLFLNINDKNHYSTFGDDSETIDDTPTLGRLFLRYEKNKSFVQWGSYRSDLVTTDLAQIDADVYGLYTRYATDRTTSFGENRAQVDAYAADAGTVTGRDEFRSTGGSLYVLSQRNLVGGSARIRIEVRDRDSGLTVSSNALTEGSDYTIDYIQGRVILLTPLSSAAQEQELVRTGSLGGDIVYLVVRYEYTPGFDRLTTLEYGGRVSGWISDKWQIGATASSNRHSGDTSTLQGIDVRYRYSQGTWIGLEASRTDGLLPLQSVSLDGGFSRTSTSSLSRINQTATAWRLESSLQFTDLGNAAGNVSFYAQSRQRGFAAPGQIALNDTDQFGLTLTLPFGAHQIRTSYEQYDEDARLTNRTSTLDYIVRLGSSFRLSTGLRLNDRDDRRPQSSAPTGTDQDLTWLTTSASRAASSGLGTGSRLDGVLRLDYTPASIWSLYTFYQGTLDSSGTREDNRLYGLGGGVALTDRTKMDYEVNHGSRGLGASLGMDFLVGAQTNLYVNYRLDRPIQTGGTASNQGNLVTGFRSRIKDSLSIYGEERFSHSETATGLTHAYGVDYSISDYWAFGFSFDIGTLEDPLQDDSVDRQVYTSSVSYTRNSTKISTLLQFQRDERAAHRQRTFLTKTTAVIRLSPSWRLVAGYTFSDSSNTRGDFYDGNFSEANIGMGVRPVRSDAVNALVQLSLFRDTPAISQPTTTYGYNYQQETLISAIDIDFRLNPRWTLGTKFAWRSGTITLNRAQSAREFDSNALLGILRVDWRLVKRWEVSSEFRYLNFEQAGSTRSGFLIGSYYHLNRNFKIGAGYNFTDFTDDLRDYSFDDSIPRGEGALDPASDSFRTQGFFINIVGKI